MRLIGVDDSPYLTIAEAARFLRFDATAKHPEQACRDWLHRQCVPITRRGRTLLVERSVLAAKLSMRA